MTIVRSSGAQGVGTADERHRVLSGTRMTVAFAAARRPNPSGDDNYDHLLPSGRNGIVIRDFLVTSSREEWLRSLAALRNSAKGELARFWVRT